MKEKSRPSPAEVSFGPVVTASVAAQISEQIRDSILTGRLRVDDRLPTEDELARQFNVSRPTIREALKRLAAQHLVRSRRGPTGGTFVNRPSLDDLNTNLSGASTLLVSLGEFDADSILEAREELELICVRLAAHRRSDEHLAAMAEEIAIQKRGDISDVDFCASDVRFHRLIADASANTVIRFLMHAVVEALQPIENMIIVRVRQRESIVAHHVELLEAIKAQDADRAKRGLVAQMAYIRRQFFEADQARGKRRASPAKPGAGAQGVSAGPARKRAKGKIT
jgi:Transcriptional regulators